MRRHALIAVAATTVIGAVLFAPLSAGAATPSPGPGYVQGVPTNTFGTIAPPAQENAVSGWSLPLVDGNEIGAADFFVAEGVINGNPEANYREVVVALTPFILTTASGTDRLTLPLRLRAVPDTRTAVQTTSFDSVPANNVFYCSTTEWATPSQMTQLKPTTYINGAFGASNTTATNNYQFTTVNTINCPYLHRVELTMRYVVAASGVAWLDRFVWRSSDFLSARPSLLGNPDAYVCAQPGAHDKYAECKWITGDRDGGDFNQACSGAPVPEWDITGPTFDWVPPWISHYARCLFVPLNGLDRTNALGKSWEDSAVADLQNAVVTAVDSFSVPGGCGVLFGGDIGYLGDVEINTCSWSEWANPARTVIGVILWLMFSLWGLQFLHSVFTGLYTHNDFKILAESQKGQ